MRKALRATCLLPQTPRQMSVVPPDATAICPVLFSPSRDPVDLGRFKMTLEMSPRVATNFASRVRTEGAACSLSGLM